MDAFDRLNNDIMRHNELSKQLTDYLNTEECKTLLAKPEEEWSIEDIANIQMVIKLIEDNKKHEKLLQDNRKMTQDIKGKALEDLRKMVPGAVDHYNLDNYVD
jgi:hypothetical protein